MKKYFIAILLTFLLFLTIISQAKILQQNLSCVEIIETKSLKSQDIEYSTFIGRCGLDWSMGLAVDNQGCTYITGSTRSFRFPIKNAYDKSYNFGGDVFITKLSPSGKSLEYSTFIGGNNLDFGARIIVDDDGYAYVCGSTNSKNFPLKNSIQNSIKGLNDIFIVKISPSGNDIIYSTILGGSDDDLPRDLALDKEGCVYVTGRTKSKDFPTKNSFDGTHNGTWDAFVFKISPEGNNLNFSTFLGGSDDEWGYGIDLDNQGCIYVTGNTSSYDFPLKNAFNAINKGGDAFLVKIEPCGNMLNYSTFLGGSNWENAWGLTTNEQGNTYVCGRTNSSDFPVKNPVQDKKNEGFDIFITKFSTKGDSLIYSTFIGGNNYDDANRIKVDQNGNAYFTAFTNSSDFPVMNPFDGTYNGKWDSYIVKISPDGNEFLYSSFLGGKGNDDGYDIAVDNKGCFYVTGWTESCNFPVKNAYDCIYSGFRDIFVTKFSPGEYSPIIQVKGGVALSVGLTSDENPLNWSINITGKIISGGKSNGTIPPYSYEEARLKSTFGFGKVNITISANDYKKYYSAYTLGPFLLNLRSI